MFNNLHNNVIKFSTKLNLNKLEKLNASINTYSENQTKYYTLLTNTLRSYTLVNPEFCLTADRGYTLAPVNSNTEVNTSKNLNFNTKNINVSYRDLDLLNLDNVDKLVSIIKSNGNTLGNESALNFYTRKQTTTTNFRTGFDTSLNITKNNHKYYPTNYSKAIINDLYLLSIILGKK